MSLVFIKGSGCRVSDLGASDLGFNVLSASRESTYLPYTHQELSFGNQASKLRNPGRSGAHRLYNS